MTFVRGSKLRENRQTVITDIEFNESLEKASRIENKYFRLRALAVLSIFRLTGKRRGEIAMIPLDNFKKERRTLHVTFILLKKRKGTVLKKLSTKTLSLRDPLTKHILNYLAYLRGMNPVPKYWLPSGKNIFGNYIIIPGDHLKGREVFNIVRECTDSFWPHLCRETAAADIVKRDDSIIAAFKIQRRLDLDDMRTGFNYLRRFATDKIEREEQKLRATT